MPFKFQRSKDQIHDFKYILGLSIPKSPDM